MITCTRRIQFCAGHRVYKHESKCNNLHGHNYVAYITAQAPELDDLGRVIDFGVLKGVIGTWIDENWDHGFIAWRQDMAAKMAVTSIDGQRLFLLDENPTAENLAAFLKVKSNELLRGAGYHDVTVVKVVLWETENCSAEV